MLLIDLLKKQFKKGFTVTPIEMTRLLGAETCHDTRPLYGADGKWLTKEQRGEDCQLPHGRALKCSSKHSHKDSCYRRVHLNVPVAGFLFKTDDGKFEAKVFADADVPANLGWTPNWKGLQPTFKGPPKLKAEGVSQATVDELLELDGVESAETVEPPLHLEIKAA